jgi:protein TonB
MAGKPMSRKSKFTIWHGLFASLVFHAGLVLPFVLNALSEPPDEPPTLVIELEGVEAETQAVQKVQQETKGEEKQDKPKPPTAEPPPTPEPPKPDPPKPVEPPPPQKVEDPPVDDKDALVQTPAPEEPAPPSPPAVQSGKPGANNVIGADQRQIAQTIRVDPETEIERLREYVKLLSKKVQAHLVYPDDGRDARLRGTAKVSFTILTSGQIRPETLRIAESSGQPKLDASALQTIRASLPFDPAPKEMTIGIAVAYGRKR